MKTEEHNGRWPIYIHTTISQQSVGCLARHLLHQNSSEHGVVLSCTKRSTGFAVFLQTSELTLHFKIFLGILPGVFSLPILSGRNISLSTSHYPSRRRYKDTSYLTRSSKTTVRSLHHTFQLKYKSILTFDILRTTYFNHGSIYTS